MRTTINKLNDSELVVKEELRQEGWEVTKPDFPNLLAYKPGSGERKFLLVKQLGYRLSRNEKLSISILREVFGVEVEIVLVKRADTRIISRGDFQSSLLQQARKMPSISYGRMTHEMDLNSQEVKEQIHKDDIDEYKEIFSSIKPTILTDEQREELRLFREKSARELAEKEADAKRKYEEMKMVQSQMGVFDTIEGRHQSVDEAMKEIKDIIRGGRAPNLTNTPMSNENDEGGK